MASNASGAMLNEGVAALQAGDAARARRAFEAAVSAGAANAQTWLYLAHSCTLLGDAAAAGGALDRVLAQEPGNLYALCMKGDLAVAAADDRAAVSFYGFALRNVPQTGLSPDLVERLRAAQAAMAAAQGRFAARLDKAVGTGAHPPRFREAMAILKGESPVYLQQPTSFFYPGLAPTPFFDTASMPWIAALERAGPEMLRELEALIAQETGFEPYVRTEPGRPSRGHALLDDPRWSAFHLWRSGEPVPENAARCPATMTALAEAPMPHIATRSPMALFSALRPKTHIPPHTGMLNTRLICHIPLIVPPGCRLRVGAETRAVEPFRAMLFDDSIEHEAWNDSDALRVVLLFEVWRPDIDAAERSLLTTMYEAIGDYGA